MECNQGPALASKRTKVERKSRKSGESSFWPPLESVSYSDFYFSLFLILLLVFEFVSNKVTNGELLLSELTPIQQDSHSLEEGYNSSSSSNIFQHSIATKNEESTPTESADRSTHQSNYTSSDKNTRATRQLLSLIESTNSLAKVEQESEKEEAEATSSDLNNPFLIGVGKELYVMESNDADEETREESIDSTDEFAAKLGLVPLETENENSLQSVDELENNNKQRRRSQKELIIGKESNNNNNKTKEESEALATNSSSSSISKKFNKNHLNRSDFSQEKGRLIIRGGGDKKRFVAATNNKNQQQQQLNAASTYAHVKEEAAWFYPIELNSNTFCMGNRDLSTTGSGATATTASSSSSSSGSSTSSSLLGVNWICKGIALTKLPSALEPKPVSLRLANTGIETLDKKSLTAYKDSLRDFSIESAPKLLAIEADAFEQLIKLRVLYIVHAPKLISLDLALTGFHPNLTIIHIQQTALRQWPEWKMSNDHFRQERILTSFELDNNKIESLGTKPINIRTGLLNLESNYITRIEEFTFNGSEIGALSLKRNLKLSFIHENAFANLKNLLKLDLSSTSIYQLPSAGLHQLRTLLIRDTYALKRIPSIYAFPMLETAGLTYAYHCCSFRYPKSHDPIAYEQHVALQNRINDHCSSRRGQEGERGVSTSTQTSHPTRQTREHSSTSTTNSPAAATTTFAAGRREELNGGPIKQELNPLSTSRPTVTTSTTTNSDFEGIFEHDGPIDHSSSNAAAQGNLAYERSTTQGDVGHNDQQFGPDEVIFASSTQQPLAAKQDYYTSSSNRRPAGILLPEQVTPNSFQGANENPRQQQNGASEFFNSPGAGAGVSVDSLSASDIDNMKTSINLEQPNNNKKFSLLHNVECGEISSDVRNITCTPEPDAFNPCEDIMGYSVLRFAVWLVVGCSVFGNTAVIVVQMGVSSFRRHWSVPKLLQLNLAIGDLCMGIYLMMLALADLTTAGTYFNYAIDWQHGAGCQLAGASSLFASQLSIFTLSVLTFERYFTITYSIDLNMRLQLGWATRIMLLGWIYAFGSAILPIFAGINSYSMTSICIPMRTSHLWDRLYLFVLLFIDSSAFVILLACYLRMYLLIVRQKTEASAKERTVAMRMALLVFTDFACWAPIIFFSLTALFGRPLISVTNSKILVVLFYPLNSMANPFLYVLYTRQYKRDLAYLSTRWREWRFKNLFHCVNPLRCSPSSRCHRDRDDLDRYFYTRANNHLSVHHHHHRTLNHLPINELANLQAIAQITGTADHLPRHKQVAQLCPSAAVALAGTVAAPATVGLTAAATVAAAAGTLAAGDQHRREITCCASASRSLFHRWSRWTPVTTFNAQIVEVKQRLSGGRSSNNIINNNNTKHQYIIRHQLLTHKQHFPHSLDHHHRAHASGHFSPLRRNTRDDKRALVHRSIVVTTTKNDSSSRQKQTNSANTNCSYLEQQQQLDHASAAGGSLKFLSLHSQRKQEEETTSEMCSSSRFISSSAAALELHSSCFSNSNHEEIESISSGSCRIGRRARGLISNGSGRRSNNNNNCCCYCCRHCCRSKSSQLHQRCSLKQRNSSSPSKKTSLTRRLKVSSSSPSLSNSSSIVVNNNCHHNSVQLEQQQHFLSTGSLRITKPANKPHPISKLEEHKKANHKATRNETKQPVASSASTCSASLLAIPLRDNKMSTSAHHHHQHHHRHHCRHRRHQRNCDNQTKATHAQHFNSIKSSYRLERDVAHSSNLDQGTSSTTSTNKNHARSEKKQNNNIDIEMSSNTPPNSTTQTSGVGEGCFSTCITPPTPTQSLSGGAGSSCNLEESNGDSMSRQSYDEVHRSSVYLRATSTSSCHLHDQHNQESTRTRTRSRRELVVVGGTSSCCDKSDIRYCCVRKQQQDQYDENQTTTNDKSKSVITLADGFKSHSTNSTDNRRPLRCHYHHYYYRCGTTCSSIQKSDQQRHLVVDCRGSTQVHQNNNNNNNNHHHHHHHGHRHHHHRRHHKHHRCCSLEKRTYSRLEGRQTKQQELRCASCERDRLMKDDDGTKGLSLVKVDGDGKGASSSSSSKHVGGGGENVQLVLEWKDREEEQQNVEEKSNSEQQQQGFSMNHDTIDAKHVNNNNINHPSPVANGLKSSLKVRSGQQEEKLAAEQTDNEGIWSLPFRSKLLNLINKSKVPVLQEADSTRENDVINKQHGTKDEEELENTKNKQRSSFTSTRTTKKRVSISTSHYSG